VGRAEQLSLTTQCRLAGISRSSLYYEAVGESEENLLLMRLLDEQYTRTPFYGVRRMVIGLAGRGWLVNPKRVRRMMQVLGIQAIYPRPKLTAVAPGHRIYPYLLRGLRIERPNQVWASDITFIRLRQGFIYLTAVLDWYSRYVLAYEVSATLDTEFCASALDWALASGCSPEIFNTDQGSQFTSALFVNRLTASGIRISMDGRGRALDNVFIERLWRTVKYEEVYLKDYLDMGEAIDNLKRFFQFYNEERPHQALGYRTPASVWRAA
jgi:putative transposase